MFLLFFFIVSCRSGGGASLFAGRLETLTLQTLVLFVDYVSFGLNPFF